MNARKVIVIVSVIVLAASASRAEDPVVFADATLKAAVEEKLGITDPTQTDMLALSELFTDDKDIADLTGLEHATNLWYLHLNNHQIADVSVLAGLSNLEMLYLKNNQISDVSTLSGLTGLTTLDLLGNQITDISALSGMINLVELTLGNNYISVISPLSGMTNLVRLDLGYNQISDISILSGMSNLTELSLDKNQIVDISALSGMTELAFLMLHYNQISDISALSGLTNLTQLHLWRNQITDISALSGMTNLTLLRLENNQISDISGLSGITSLLELRLHNNQISDISPLQYMTTLTFLNLEDNPLNQESCDVYIPMIEDNNPGIVLLYDPYSPTVSFADATLKAAVEEKLEITDPTQTDMLALSELFTDDKDIADLTGLEHATNLWYLHLNNHQIADVSVLAGLSNLEMLYLKQNQISDISTLSGLTGLSTLDLLKNQITDISALSGMINFVNLTLGNNYISNISALSGMINLVKLDLGNNQISDIITLSTMTNLTELSLDRNQITDIGVLSGMTELVFLMLSFNQITDISPLSEMTNMTQLRLENNLISDISVLSGMTSLSDLRLQNNQVSNISALSGLTNLTLLRLEGNPLNRESYCNYIPIIQANNPSINLTADPNPYNCDDNTQVGENVDVAPVDENSPTGDTPLTLTFESVTESGNTILATYDSGPPPPTGLKLLGTYYEINTTADVSGEIHIDLEYDDTGLTPQQENNLKLRRYNETTQEWEDITYGIVDTENNIIYGLTDHLSFFAVIYNVSPVIGSIDAPLAPVQVNTEFTTLAFFSDPDTFDIHTAMWYWGDLDSTPGIVDEGTQIITGSHTYTSAGVYTITLTVMDEAGAASNAIFEYVVVYDRSAGFVTGGGWINSPPGAYTADPSLTGKANFGFVAKYKTGAEAPTGQTEFKFSTGNLNFHSSSYEWLVVNQAGTNAQFKGSGTINGAGNYKFMLWAGDDNPDTFRIRIWTEDEDGAETVTYDNGFGQEIGGGSIVIHTN